MNIGQNKPLMIGGGLLFLLMIACGYFLWTFHGKNKTAASDLDTKQTTLNGLVGKEFKDKAPTPSPTAANVAELDAQIEAAAAYYTNYVDTLFKDLPEERKAEPSDFQLEIETKVNAARAFAKENEVELGVAEDAAANMLGGIPGLFPGVVPGQPGAAVENEEVFFMDFEKYTKDGERPERSHIPRLSRQLDILDDLTRLLVEHGADRIVAVERDKFDLAAQEANQQGMLNFPNPFNPGGPVEEEKEEIPFENEVFKLVFQAEEAKAFETLGAINQLPYPAAVSQVHIKNQHMDMVPFAEAQAGALGAIPGAGIPGIDGIGGAANTKKDMTDLILSAGREPVEVEVEIYIATPPKQEADDEEGSPFGL